MQEQFINIRFESMKMDRVINEIKHELRTTKIYSVVNDNHNMLLTKNDIGEWTKTTYKTKDKETIIKGKDQINNLVNIEDRHRKLLRKNYNQSLNKKRVNSFNVGVLTFSDSIINYDNDKIFDLGIKTIKNICEELNIELHYITYHLDEKGLPHFHYLTDNFDASGKTINPKHNKNLGSKLQDLGAKYFSELGFKRGVSKDITGKKHLNTKEFGEYQETLKEIDILKDSVFALVDTFLDLGLNYKKKSPEDLLKLFERYITTDKLEKLVKTLEKISIKANIDNSDKVKMSDLVKKITDIKKIINHKTHKGN
jgi:hypothetical protein